MVGSVPALLKEAWLFYFMRKSPLTTDNKKVDFELEYTVGFLFDEMKSFAEENRFVHFKLKVISFSGP